jgi:serine/threonine protein kinase
MTSKRQETGICQSCGHTVNLRSENLSCPTCGHRGKSPAKTELSDECIDLAAAEPTRSGERDPTQADLNFTLENGPTPRAAKRRLGRFVLVKQLGRGAFGEVWEAVDERLSRKVALKLPLFGPRETRKAQRFVNEAKAAARLRHPNIVGVYDFGEIEGRKFLASELVEGQSLPDFVARNSPAPDGAAVLVAKLARALQFAHVNQIIHRDIKPQNIVVSAEGEPRIVDFGLAKLTLDSGLTMDGSAIGTPAYMAPEQAKGELSRLGPWSDQYSLGATLYWLLTGRRLYDGPAAVVLAQIATGSPVSLQKLAPSLDRRLIAICEKAIAKSPEDRYRSCLEFAEDLERFVNDEPVQARPFSVTTRVIRFCRRNYLDVGLITGTAALMLLSLGLVSSAWWNTIAHVRQARRIETEVIESVGKVAAAQENLQEEQRKMEQAKSRAEKSRQALVEEEERLRTAEKKLSASIEENLRLLKIADDRRIVLSENMAEIEEIKTQYRIALEESARLAKWFELDTRLDVYSKAAKAIQDQSWDVALQELSKIDEPQRGWLWTTLKHFESKESDQIPYVNLAVDLQGLQENRAVEIVDSERAFFSIGDQSNRKTVFSLKDGARLYQVSIDSPTAISKRWLVSGGIARHMFRNRDYRVPRLVNPTKLNSYISSQEVLFWIVESRDNLLIYDLEQSSLNWQLKSDETFQKLFRIDQTRLELDLAMEYRRYELSKNKSEDKVHPLNNKKFYLRFQLVAAAELKDTLLVIVNHEYSQDQVIVVVNFDGPLARPSRYFYADQTDIPQITRTMIPSSVTLNDLSLPALLDSAQSGDTVNIKVSTLPLDATYPLVFDILDGCLCVRFDETSLPLTRIPAKLLSLSGEPPLVNVCPTLKHVVLDLGSDLAILEFPYSLQDVALRGN